MDFAGTDLTVFVELSNGELSMTVTKANKSVYRVVLEQATMPIENAWLADMRDDRVQLRARFARMSRNTSKPST